MDFIQTRSQSQSSEAESGHTRQIGEAVRATKRTSKTFARKESQGVLQMSCTFVLFEFNLHYFLTVERLLLSQVYMNTT